MMRYRGLMDLALQGSLLDLVDEMTLRELGSGLHRTTLGAGAWVDLRPGWLAAGDEVFTALLHEVPWRAERRQMYDSIVDVPRLTRHYAAHESLPHPMLAQARDALSAHYASELGEPFVTAGLCLYRDGRDSFQLGHGDLVVMGGSCQRTWDHAIPKLTAPVGPRISVQFRVAGVR